MGGRISRPCRMIGRPWDREDTMFKFKTIAAAAVLALTIVGIAAMMAPAGSAVAPQIDAIELMSKAADLPVEQAPEI